MKSKENPDDILSKYKVYLRLEKSLSDNTVSAYLADISKLFQFLLANKPRVGHYTYYHRQERTSIGCHTHWIKRFGIHYRCQIRQRNTRKHYRHHIVNERQYRPTTSTEEPTEAEMYSCKHTVPHISSQILVAKPYHLAFACE